MLEGLDMDTKFSFAEMTPVVKLPDGAKKVVKCFCAHCQGKDQRIDVRHYKLFTAGGHEYYLNLDMTNKIGTLRQKE